MSYIYMQKANK